jgi:hypothetical protein
MRFGCFLSVVVLDAISYKVDKDAAINERESLTIKVKVTSWSWTNPYVCIAGAMVVGGALAQSGGRDHQCRRRSADRRDQRVDALDLRTAVPGALVGVAIGGADGGLRQSAAGSTFGA